MSGYKENEKRELCLKFCQIFLSQPILLELEALLKIVMIPTGNIGFVSTFGVWWFPIRKQTIVADTNFGDYLPFIG